MCIDSFNYVNRFVPEAIQKQIKNDLNIIETGTVTGDYTNVTIYNDGRNDTYQITYGRCGVTEQGNLKSLIQMYVDNHGQYANNLSPYLPKIGNRNTPLVEDQEFIKYLKLAGEDQIMKICQDTVFDKFYYFPACEFFYTNLFTLPLSLLVIYDSFIHSGEIFQFLRNKFVEKTPVYGGDEKIWIQNYTIARNNWLLSSSKKELRKSSYRTKFYLQQIKDQNWNLSKPYVLQGISVG